MFVFHSALSIAGQALRESLFGNLVTFQIKEKKEISFQTAVEGQLSSTSSHHALLDLKKGIPPANRACAH